MTRLKLTCGIPLIGLATPPFCVCTWISNVTLSRVSSMLFPETEFYIDMQNQYLFFNFYQYILVKNCIM